MVTQIINNGKPYQLMFGIGAIQGILIILWWGYDIFARFTGLPIVTASGVVSHWAHIYLMVFSFFPLFIFGFLMTAYPVWMGSEPIKLKSNFFSGIESHLFRHLLFSCFKSYIYINLLM